MRDMGYGIQIEPSICWVGFGTAHSNKEHREHAQLIAAAPVLLSALQVLVGIFSKLEAPGQGGGCHYSYIYSEEFSQANEAIQLATKA